MAIQHHPSHYEPFYEAHEEPASSASAFVAALALLLLLFLVVVLLWAPWSSAGDTSGTNPTLNQPVQIQPGAAVPPDGIQIAPAAPQNPGSTAGR